MWVISLKNKTFSIKRRLTISIIVVASLLLVVSLYFSLLSARDEIEEVYDARLGQSAKLLLMVSPVATDRLTFTQQQQQFDLWMNRIQKLTEDDDSPATAYGHPYEQNILFQFYQDEHLLWSSNKRLGPLPLLKHASGYGDISMKNEQWRYFKLAMANTSEHQQYIVVAEKQSIRQEVIDKIAFTATLPQLILVPCLIMLLVLLIDKNFKPIAELGTAIAQRSAHKLDRIYVTNQTRELSPLVDALNQLLVQLEQAWQREKRFTRMAAHELKTPLTILRLNAENAILSENPQQLRQDLDNILKGIDRTDRLLHQLLTLAKVESITDLISQNFDLAKVLQQALADLAPIALRQHQELSFEGDSCYIDGDEILLSILFRNLIDNAIRYSGSHSEIDVKLKAQANDIEVTISDSGTDISQDTREKLFDNFYRANTEKGDGAGLGMSISRDIAELHHATVRLLPRTQQRNTFQVRFNQRS